MSASTSATYTLYGGKGAGSTVIEAVLTLLGQPYRYEEAAPWDGGPGVEKLRAVNPLVQVPTLVLPDGAVLTESAAMILALLDRHPGSDLMPPPGDPARVAFYRWLVFIPANIYAMYSIGDDPSRWLDDKAAQAQLKERSVERTKFFWGVMESNVEPAPYLLGERMSVLDLYVAMISHWRPGRACFREQCPKLWGAVERAEAHPVIAPIWARNFGGA